MYTLKNVFLRGDGEVTYNFLVVYDVNEHGIVIESNVTGLMPISKESDMYEDFLNEIKNQKLLSEFENVTFVGKPIQGNNPDERMLVLFENSKNYIGVNSVANYDFFNIFNNGNVTIINKDSQFIDRDANLKLTMNEKHLLEKYNTVEKLLRAAERNKTILTPTEIASSINRSRNLLQEYLSKNTNENQIKQTKADLLVLKTFENKFQKTMQF